MFQGKLKELRKGTKPAHSPAAKNRTQSEVPSTSGIYEDAGRFSATGSVSPTSSAAPSDRCRSATEKKTLDTATLSSGQKPPGWKSPNRVPDSSSDPAPAVLKNLKITSVRIRPHVKFLKKNKKVDATDLTATDRPSTSTSGHGHKSSHRESDAPVSPIKKTKKRLSRMFSSISNRITNITKTPNIYNEQEIKSDLPSTGRTGDDAEQQETFAEPAVLNKKSKGAAFNLNITSVRISSHLKKNKKVDATDLTATDRPSTSTSGHGHKSSHKESGSPTSLAAPSDGCRSASEQETLPIATPSSEKQPSWNNQVLVTDNSSDSVNENESDLPSTGGLSDKWLPNQNMKKELNEDKEESTATNPSSTNLPASACTTSLTPVSPTSLPAPSASRRTVYIISFRNVNSATGCIKTPVIYHKQENESDLPSTSRSSDKWLLYQKKKEERYEDKEESTATIPSSTTLPASTCITNSTPVSPTSSPAPSASRRRVHIISFRNVNSATGCMKTPVIYNKQEKESDLPSTSGLSNKWLLYQKKKKELNENKEESTATNASSTNLPASTFITSMTPVSLTSLPAPSASRRRVVRISFSNSKWIKTPVIYKEQETTSDLPSANGIDEDAEQPETFAVDKEATFNTSNTPELDDHPILTSIKHPVAFAQQTEHVGNTSTTGLTSVSPTSLAAPSDGCRSASEQETLPIATPSSEQKQPSWNNQVLVTDNSSDSVNENESDLPSTGGLSDKWLLYQNIKKELNEDKEESTATNPSSTNLPASTCTTSLTPVSPTSLAAPSDGCRSASEQETLPIATPSSERRLPNWIGPLFKCFIIYNRITSFQIPFLPN